MGGQSGWERARGRRGRDTPDRSGGGALSQPVLAAAPCPPLPPLAPGAGSNSDRVQPRAGRNGRDRGPAPPPHPGAFKFHQYQVVGRHTPTPTDPSPPLFRMKLWATDAPRARSKFWYYLARLRKVKKANGQIVACNEIFEKRPTTVKNFGIWVR